MDDFYRRVVSSDEEDFDNSDDGSITDLDRDMSDEVDCCDSDVVDVAPVCQTVSCVRRCHVSRGTDVMCLMMIH